MKMIRKIKIISVACVVASSGFSALADMPFERTTRNISKLYDNGDSISMTCRGARNQTCVLKARIGGVQRKFDLDFAKHGLAPTLQSIRMVGQSARPWAFAADISTHCDDRVDTLLPAEARSASCNVVVYLNGAGGVTWGAAYVQGGLKPVPLPPK